jgi:hypothetical protein
MNPERAFRITSKFVSKGPHLGSRKPAVDDAGAFLKGAQLNVDPQIDGQSAFLGTLRA